MQADNNTRYSSESGTFYLAPTDTLLPAFGEGEPRGGKSHRGAGGDVQRQVAHQFDGTADVLAGGGGNPPRGAVFGVQRQVAHQFEGTADVLAGGDDPRPPARRFVSLNRRSDG